MRARGLLQQYKNNQVQLQGSGEVDTGSTTEFNLTYHGPTSLYLLISSGYVSGGPTWTAAPSVLSKSADAYATIASFSGASTCFAYWKAETIRAQLTSPVSATPVTFSWANDPATNRVVTLYQLKYVDQRTPIYSTNYWSDSGETSGTKSVTGPNKANKWVVPHYFQYDAGSNLTSLTTSMSPVYGTLTGTENSPFLYGRQYFYKTTSASQTLSVDVTQTGSIDRIIFSCITLNGYVEKA